MSLQALCDVAKACSLTKVFDVNTKQIIHMNLDKYNKIFLRGGTVRAIFEVSPHHQVKVYVFSCKRSKRTTPCSSCMNKSHHKCETPVYLHVLVHKN
jgi:hypothetical protein